MDPGPAPTGAQPAPDASRLERLYYEDYWSGDDGAVGRMSAQLQRLLTRHVPSTARCLDVGCGDGRGAGLWLNDHAAGYVGIDISEAAVEAARSLGLDARAIEDATRLPFPDGEFDAVVCVEVLEHLFAPHDAVKEICRVLRPGGVFLATVPNIAYWRRRLDLGIFGRWNPMGDELSVERPWRDPHLRFFTKESLGRMVASAGFIAVHASGHSGALVRDVPGLRSLGGSQPSNLYESLERARPSFFGYRLHAIATKPDP